MKKIIAILLVIITVLSVIACNDSGKTPAGSGSDNTPGNNDQDNGQNTEEINIPFVENGKSTVYIVVPEQLTAGVNHARTRLQLAIREKTGVTVLSGTMSDTEYEIHLGNTGAEAAAMIEALGEDEYAIKAVDKRLYFVAKNDLWLYDVIEIFLEMYMEKAEYFESGNKSLVLKKSIDRTAKTKTNTLRYYLSLGQEELNASVEVAATATNNLQESTSSKTVPYRRQGGCFNGTNYYQGLITKNEEYGRIMMRNTVTGEMIFSECRQDMGHINDMDYNSKTNEVLVSNGSTIVIFDGTTLAYKRTVKASVSSGSQIAYDPIKDQYVFARAPYKYVKNDFSTATGKVIESNQSLQDKYGYNAFQGTACDGYFFIALQARSGAGTYGGYSCHAAVYSTDGTYLGNIKIEIPNGYEPENVSIYNGDIYVAACTPVPTATLYRVVIESPEK